MANPVMKWAADNPVAAGAAALGVVVVVMMLAGGGSSAAESNDLGGAGVAAYYSAVAQQGQAGAAIQIEQIKANASTNQALIAASYGIENSKIWAPISAQANQNATMLQADQQLKAWDLGRYQIESNERLGANTNAANVQIAAHQASAARAAAKAGKPSGFAQGVNAVSNLVGSVSKVIPFL